jgi:phospholipid/cholesterol/gamma-HCH transport system substrate-binding protein
MKVNNETKIGLMVCVAAVLLAVMSFKTGKFNLTKSGHTIKTRFKNIDGVNLNSPVMFNGFEVGIVEDIAIKENDGETFMELTLWVDDEAKAREGTKAYIKNLGFMGEKYVGLTSGAKGGDYLTAGAVIVGQDPPNIERLLAEGEEIAGRLKSITRNIDERLETNKDALDNTLANLNVTMKSLASIVSNINERLEANERKIDDTVSNMYGLSVNLEELSYDLKLNPWKVLYREKVKKEER